jgi:acyl-CoA synthetase (NDP forming)
MGGGVAIVGASENNFWSGHALNNLDLFGYQGEIWPVNPNYPTVAGRKAYATLLDIPGTLDAVIVAVATHRCPEIVRQAVTCGASDIVVVADGFAERDPDGFGAALQRELVATCPPGTRLYGPNCVGFADFRRSLCAIAEPIPVESAVGDISIVSQSGAMVSSMMAAIAEDGGGFDWCVSLGNAAQFDLPSAIDYACERGTTRVLGMYVETLGVDGLRLRAALTRAARERVSVVMLKAGRTGRSARIALSHTASVAGDDAQVDALLRAYGVLRVESFDELARVAVLARLDQRRMGPPAVVFIGSSGGQAAVASDLAARDGLALAALTEPTREVMCPSVAPGSFIENPLDLVGRPGAKTSIDEVFATVYLDPTVGLAVSPWSVVFPDDTPGRATHRASITLAIDTGLKTGTPTVITSATHVPWTEWMLQTRRDNPGVAVVRGLETTIRALSRLYPAEPDAGAAPDPPANAPAGMVGEIEGRRLLTELGLPFVRGEVCADADAAAAACERLTPPVVVKLDIEGISHKAKVGGVVVGCRSADEVRAAVMSAYAQLAEHGRGPDQVLGILVEEQADGVEVLAGLSRSETGAFLTVGAGGALAGAGTSACTLLLPADREDIERVLWPFVRPVDPLAAGPAAAAEAIQRLCEAFDAELLSGYATAEINPMFVSAHQAAIADVLLVATS